MKDVIVIGAGAAGLMAAKILAENGLKVLILEARNRIGGRIHCLPSAEWSFSAEGGAEFIHGNLTVTFQLLEEAGFSKKMVQGNMWQVENGTWRKADNFIEHEQLVVEKLQSLQQDISVTAFLNQEFAGDSYVDLQQSLLAYVQGYYAADPKNISAQSFLAEWQSEDEQQYRPTNGYGAVVKFLADHIEKNGGEIVLNTVVKSINWKQDEVEVTDANYRSFKAKKLINTVPLGVWTTSGNHESHLNYSPELPQKLNAANKLGFGAVIKVLIRFTDDFYKMLFETKEDTGFIFSNAGIGTWWTQNPNNVPVLTGWLAGPNAEQHRNSSDEIVFTRALDAIATIFSQTKQKITDNIIKWEVFNWSADIFTRGGYSYSSLHAAEFRKILKEPIENTLFFAGEALYDGTEMGTVEAALTSGLQTADEILKGL